jgi:hypothetical protein
LRLDLSCFTTTVQAALSDGVSFDPFAFEQDGLASPEVDVGQAQDCRGSRGIDDGCSARRKPQSGLRGLPGRRSFPRGCGFERLVRLFGITLSSLNTEESGREPQLALELLGSKQFLPDFM